MEDEPTLKAVVIFKGDKARHHSEELRRRPLRGDEREAIAEVLITKLPRSLHLEKIAKLEENVMESGCRDQVPATGVMKTISWASRKKRRQHQNEMTSLQTMLEDGQT